MEERIEKLEKEIGIIKERNRKVEADKAWETSSIRKVLVALVTYVLITIYMYYLDVNRPLINAIVPTLGFLISTLTIGWAKSLWLRSKSKK